MVFVSLWGVCVIRSVFEGDGLSVGVNASVQWPIEKTNNYCLDPYDSYISAACPPFPLPLKNLHFDTDQRLN